MRNVAEDYIAFNKHWGPKIEKYVSDRLISKYGKS